VARIGRYSILRSVSQLSRSLIGRSERSADLRVGRRVSAEGLSSFGCAWHPCCPEFEQRYVVRCSRGHCKWDKLLAFAIALAVHSVLFIGLWRNGKVQSPLSATTVSIVYLGPASPGATVVAGGGPRAVRAAPLKRKPSMTDARMPAKPLATPERVPAPTAETAAAAKAPPTAETAAAAERAPFRSTGASSEALGTARSPAAADPTRVPAPATGVVATQSVALSEELSVNCAERTSPVYPRLSLRLGEQGRTLLLVELDERGRVANVSVKTSSGFTRLDEAAVSAVKGWRCTPAIRNGLAVRSVATQPFNFALTGR